MPPSSRHFQPRFVMARPCWPEASRTALKENRTIRERRPLGGVAVYTPVRIKPRYWTSQTIGASVIHVATGRGVWTQGSGQIEVEPYCYGRLEWPRPLSSPDDCPERRLCNACIEKAHASELLAAQSDPAGRGVGGAE
jgi:hypothetical protein